MSTVPGKDREEESGKYTTSYPDSDFLDSIHQLDGLGGTSEIVEVVGCSRRTTYTRFQTLEKESDIVSRKIRNAIVWTILE